jgi:hypothetical protein
VAHVLTRRVTPRTAERSPRIDRVSADPRLQVREMQLAEVGIRIDYFHDASDEHLLTLGVQRALLPSRQAWRDWYEADCARPIQPRLV